MKITVTGVPDRVDIQLDRFCPFNDGGRRRCGNWCVLFGDERADLWEPGFVDVPICHNKVVHAIPTDNVTVEYFRAHDEESEE